MPRPRRSAADQSYKLKIELRPLYAHGIPARSRKHLAKHPPKGPLLANDIWRHIEDIKTSTANEPLVFISDADVLGILDSLQIRVPQKRLPQLAEAINAAMLEYDLRLRIERMPLSSWFPRYQKIVFLLGKLRALLPNKEKDALLFNIIRDFGESYAASHGPHPGLAPYELADPLDNFPFPVNYRSDERLEQTIRGINEIASWMLAFLDVRVDEVAQSNREKMSAATWLIGYELPRIYEKFLDRSFGVTLSTRKYGPGIRFILFVLDAVEIRTSTGRKYSPTMIKTYRRRARKYDKR